MLGFTLGRGPEGARLAALIRGWCYQRCYQEPSPCWARGGRIADMAGRARDQQHALLERLPERVEGRTVELRQLVQYDFHRQSATSGDNHIAWCTG